MGVPFQVVPLARKQFESLIGASDEVLRTFGARRVVAESSSGDRRVSLADAEAGERLLLLPYPHHDVDSPYRASSTLPS